MSDIFLCRIFDNPKNDLSEYQPGAMPGARYEPS